MHTQGFVIDLETSQILSMPSRLIRMAVVKMEIVRVEFGAFLTLDLNINVSLCNQEKVASLIPVVILIGIRNSPIC